MAPTGKVGCDGDRGGAPDPEEEVRWRGGAAGNWGFGRQGNKRWRTKGVEGEVEVEWDGEGGEGGEVGRWDGDEHGGWAWWGGGALMGEDIVADAGAPWGES